MLNSVFMKLLEMSAKGGIVILAVLVVRLLLRRAPRKAVFVLWAAVLLRLLCPLTLHSPVGLLSEKEIIPAATVTSTPMPVGASPTPTMVTEYTPQHTESIAPPAGNPASAPVQPIPNTDEPKTEKGITWKEMLPYLWLSGCILLLGYSIGSGLSLRYRLRESVECEKNVRMADGLESAFVLGLLRPSVYLPSELPEGARPYILAHERAHIRRLDTLWKRLGWLALCLHWFNPLVWLAFFLASRDMEMACDEQVLGGSGADIRADYSELLLRLSTGKRFLAAPLAFGEGDTGSRIRHILKWKKPRTWLMVGAALICIAAVVFCVLERSGKETVWEREVPEFRTTIRVQTDGKKFAVTHTKPKKRAADGTKSEHIRLEKPVEDADGIYLTGVRDYYDAVRNRSAHDSLTLYLLTPENIKELRDAEWEQAGIRFEVRVLDGEALLILAIQQWGVNSDHVDVRETGLLLASGGKPGAAEQTDETTPSDETTPPENIDLSVSEGYRALTAEELRTANDHLNIPFSDWAEKRDLTGAVHAFHTCHYDDPTELDLQEFLRYLLYGDETLQAGEDEEEFQLWQARNGGFAAEESIADMPVPVHRYSAEKVNEVLTEYAGITVDDLILPYWEMSYYLPETDAFYNTTSDFGMGTFRCEAGETDGETVRLYTDASRHSCVVLTLRKSGEKWMIAARQMTDENGNILSAVLAGEWQYRLSAKYMQELFENRETLPLDKFIRFLLKADGAYAEGGAAELYRRFLSDPVTVLRYLLTWGESTVPEHPDKTAAQVICEMLATEAAWFGDAEAFTNRLDWLTTVFPEGRGQVLVEYLRSAYTQISEALGGYTAGLAAVAPEKGLALYRDDTPAQMEQRGAFPWGLGLTAEQDEYFEDGSYRVVCTDGTVIAGMYCGGDSVPNLKDVSFLYFDTQNPAFRTLNGVSVGMSRTEALERFNCPGDEAMAVCFDNEQGQIILRFADGLVSEIEMCAFGFAKDRAAALGADYEQESSLRLYADGFDRSIGVQPFGAFPWGYLFEAESVRYFGSDGFNCYEVICTDGTRLSGFRRDKTESLDAVSLTGIYTENPAFATPNGVRVGMQRSETPGAGSGDIYIAAQKDYLQIVVHFDGDTVSALELVQGMDAAMYAGGSSGNTDASGSSEPDGVKLSYSDVTLSASNEESYALSLENLPADASVNYSSDDTAIATVSSDGVVKAVGHGTASISVKITLGGETRTLKCIVRVM